MFFLQILNFLKINYKLILYTKNKTIDIFILKKNYSKIINIILKLSIFFKKSILIDLITYQKISYKTTWLTIYIIKLLPINYTLKFFIQHKGTLNSLNYIYINSIWFERENSEFFNVNFMHTFDNRNLLLPYSMIDAPLLKHFPTLGFKETYYNINTNSIIYKLITNQV